VLKGILAGLAAGALWGLVFIAPSLAGGLTAIDLVGWRFFFYALMSLAVMAFSRGAGRLPTLPQAGAALGMSVLGFSGYYLLLVLAIRDVGVEVPSLIIGTIPVWVMLLGKPQGLLWRGLIPGLLLTIVGVVLMGQASLAQTGDSVGLATVGWTYWRGLGFAVLAMVSWTVFALLNSVWLRKHSEVRTTDWTNWLGVGSGLVGMAVWFVMGTDLNVLLAQEGIAQAAIVCIAAGAGSAWFATVLWNIASRHLSASLCGQLIVSETLFALLYAFVWTGHWPLTTQVVASVVFVMGILASIRAHR
jgi:drug/metabolite transporter (DMT)-like permease